MAKHITVRGAQPYSKNEEADSTHITIARYFPYATGKANLEELGRGFKEDAESLFGALLESLPGGTFCQLLVLMLQEKASRLIVSHKPTSEYQKTGAAAEMHAACESALAVLSGAVTQHSRRCAIEEGDDCDCWLPLRRSAIDRLQAALAKARGESGAQDG